MGPCTLAAPVRPTRGGASQEVYHEISMINEKSRPRAAITNVSSMLAFSGSVPPGRPERPGLPYRTTYAATKSLINTFTELLHHELDGTGVRVQALCSAT